MHGIILCNLVEIHCVFFFFFKIREDLYLKENQHSLISVDFEALTVPLIKEGIFKVIIGGYPDRAAADEAKTALINNGFDGAWIIER